VNGEKKENSKEECSSQESNPGLYLAKLF